MRKEQGFTLIELMIVVAIIGILASVALPAYQNYATRASVTEAMSLAAGAKSSSAEIFSSEGAFPLDNTGAGLETNTAITGTNVASVTVTRTGAGTVTTPGTSNELGTIVIAFNANNATLNGNSVTLTANSSGGSITWVCTSTLPNASVPASCRP